MTAELTEMIRIQLVIVVLEFQLRIYMWCALIK